MGGRPDPGGDPDGPTEVDRDGDRVQHQWQFGPLVKQVKVGSVASDGKGGSGISKQDAVVVFKKVGAHLPKL